MKKIRIFVFLQHVTWMLFSWECFTSLYVFVATWVSLCFSEEPQVGWLTSLEMRVEKNKVQFHLNLLSHFLPRRHFTIFLWVIFILLTSCVHLILETKQKQKHVALLPLVRLEQLSDYDIAAKKIRSWFTSLQCLQVIINPLGLISLRS